MVLTTLSSGITVSPGPRSAAGGATAPKASWPDVASDVVEREEIGGINTSPSLGPLMLSEQLDGLALATGRSLMVEREGMVGVAEEEEDDTDADDDDDDDEDGIPSSSSSSTAAEPPPPAPPDLNVAICSCLSFSIM